MMRCLTPEKRTLFSFRGPDAVRYLNGQLTQDVQGLSDRARPSCVTDAKGKLQAFVHVFNGLDDSIWIEAPADQEEELEARLTRYLIADDVEVENMSAGWQLVHVIDAADAPPTGSGVVRKASRVDSEGFDLWLPANELPEYSALSLAEAQTRRITARIPAWGSELSPEMLPPEAGLDRTAISYHKGCYIGQEVLSRIKSAGRVNRRLTAFLVEPGILANASLTNGARVSGRLTSVAPWPNEGGLHAAMGYLDKSAFGATELSLAGQSGTVQVLGFV